MNRSIAPGERAGRVRIPASKSQAHRLLICAALGEREVRLRCDGISRDIAATVACLNALGAKIRETAPGELLVRPVRERPAGLRLLPCGESGSTLRFLLPLAGALGAEAVFQMEGRLPQRPLAPLDRELCAHGMELSREGNSLAVRGCLKSGAYSLPGDVSSQYISGLLLALPLLEGDSRLTVTGRIESAGYIAMTESALSLAQIRLDKQGWSYTIPGGQRPRLPERLQVEGDYSNAAFFLCMGALSREGVTVSGLPADSRQGDRAVLDILRALGAEVRETAEGVFVRRGKLRGCQIDAAQVPDLIPVLSVAASAAAGETRVVNAGRLRLKESDRLESTARLINTLGGRAAELEDGLIIRGVERLSGGTVDSCGDHRIAMSAAAAACFCENSVTVLGGECVEKSYPRFWEDFDSLKGGSL